MLESSSRRLLQPGMPHHNCPDKVTALFSSIVCLLLRCFYCYTTSPRAGSTKTDIVNCRAKAQHNCLMSAGSKCKGCNCRCCWRGKHSIHNRHPDWDRGDA